MVLRADFARFKTDETYQRYIREAVGSPSDETVTTLMTYIFNTLPLLESDVEKIRLELIGYKEAFTAADVYQILDFLYFILPDGDLDVGHCIDVTTDEPPAPGTPMVLYRRVVSRPEGFMMAEGSGAIGCMTEESYSNWDKVQLQSTGRFGVPLDIQSIGYRDATGAYVGNRIRRFVFPAPAPGPAGRPTRRSAPRSTTARHINGKRRNRKVLRPLNISNRHFATKKN